MKVLYYFAHAITKCFHEHYPIDLTNPEAPLTWMDSCLFGPICNLNKEQKVPVISDKFRSASHLDIEKYL